MLNEKIHKEMRTDVKKYTEALNRISYRVKPRDCLRIPESLSNSLERVAGKSRDYRG